MFFCPYYNNPYLKSEKNHVRIDLPEQQDKPDKDLRIESELPDTDIQSNQPVLDIAVPSTTANRIMPQLNPQLSYLQEELKGYNIKDSIIKNIFSHIISFSVTYTSKHAGNPPAINQIFQLLKIQHIWIFNILCGCHVPENRVDLIVQAVIRIAISGIEKKPATAQR